MKQVVGFGDFILRLSPPGYLRFMQASSFDINYTGAEANVLVSLSMMGVDTQFVTRLPDGDVSQAALSTLKKHGVGVSNVAFGGERMGVFYLEKGASQRPSKIVYDRKFTSIAEARYEDFDWDNIFSGAGYFHITGITPALSHTMPDVCIRACEEANRRGIIVTCDLNYRKNMWTPDEAKSVMERIVPLVHTLIANEEDADKVLGIRSEGTDVVSGVINREGYIDVARQICELYGTEQVAVTLRKSLSASDNDWGAMLYTKGKAYFSRTYQVRIVDRVGGGDSFAAGLIYALGHDFDPQHAVEYAAAASCLKQTMEMDFNLSTPEEIERLVAGDGSGRVRR
ncbi:MAG: sugar kinase [Clostridia bacterium]|nr:sugar kinase [Clostridia bacterium]